MYFGIPQMILIALLFMNFGTALAKHGEAKGKYNAFETLIDILSTIAILCWGGFFSK